MRRALISARILPPEAVEPTELQTAIPALEESLRVYLTEDDYTEATEAIRALAAS